MWPPLLTVSTVATLLHIMLCNLAVSGNILEVRSDLKACKQYQKEKGGINLMRDCQEKISLSIKIKNKGKTITEEQFIIVDTVFDRVTYEDVKLLEPLVIKLRQEEVSLAYPLKKLHLVNNIAYELILHKDNVDDYKGCDASSTASATCGLQFKDGQLIPYSQGFCCPCDHSPTNVPYHMRGGQDCSNSTQPVAAKSSYHASTHCLRYDDLWYTVNALQRPSIEHVIHVGVYQRGGMARLVSYDGVEEVVVGTDYTHVASHNDKVVATYAPFSLTPSDEPLDRQTKYLLIPEPGVPDSASKVIDKLQLKGGAAEYLMVDKAHVKFGGHHCDSIGVSYPAFAHQKNRCQRHAQSCLGKQPMHLWLHDMEQRLSGKKGSYFLEHYGQLSEHPIVRRANETFVAFTYQEEHWSHIYLDINADNLTPLRQGYHGQISEIHTISNYSGSRVQVRLLNTGLVSSQFGVQISGCSEYHPEEKQDEADVHTVEIGSMQSAQVTFNGNKLFPKYGVAANWSITCSVDLLRVSGERIATRNFIMRPLETCSCIAHCICKCQSEGTWCTPLTSLEYMLAGFRGPIPGTIKTSRFAYLFEIVSRHQLLGLVIFVLVAMGFMIIGLLKACIGLCFPSVGRFGLTLFTIGRAPMKQYYESELKDRTVVYNAVGQPVHPDSGAPVRQMNILCEILMNLLFCLYLPFLPCHWLIVSAITRNKGRVHRLSPCSSTSKCGSPGSPLRASFRKDCIGFSDDDDDMFMLTPKTSSSSARRCKTKIRNITKQPSSQDNSVATQTSKNVIMENFRKQKNMLRKQLVSAKKHKENGDVFSSDDEGSSPTRRISSVTYVPSPPSSPSETSENELLGKVSTESSLGLTSSRMTIEVEKLLNCHTDVYYNFTLAQPSPLLQNSGNNFSLCGKLLKNGKSYKFELCDDFDIQISEVVDGEQRELEEPLPIWSEEFTFNMSAKKVLKLISLEPCYPCLNQPRR